MAGSKKSVAPKQHLVVSAQSSGTVKPLDLSGGSVNFGVIVPNIERLLEPEPPELAITIHNQVVHFEGDYTVGGVPFVAKYSAAFGPYPVASPNVGLISIVESPGGEHAPELNLESGYCVVGGSGPITAARKKVRARSYGTRFAAAVKPGAGPNDDEVYVVYLNRTAVPPIEVADSEGSFTQNLKTQGYFVRASLEDGEVTALTPEADVNTDPYAKDLYNFAIAKAADAGIPV